MSDATIKILIFIYCVVAFIAVGGTLLITHKVNKAVKYMQTYCNERGGNKNNVVKEFKKVLKILGM